MYKEINLIYLENGRVYNENRIYNFENENLATKINFTIPIGYESFTFVLDLKNGASTSQIELGQGETNYSYILDDSLTLTGTLELQLWATILSGNETVKVQWEKYNLTINDALNISTVTAESNPDIIATHTSQIADLYNITSILDETGDGTRFLSDDGTYKAGGSIGVTDYPSLTDKPSINSVTLLGNKTSSDLGLQPAGSYEPANANIQSHISDSNIHLTSTEKTNVGKLLSTGDGSKFLADDGIYKTGGSGGTTDYTVLINKPSINSVTLTGDKTSSDLGLQPAGSYLTSEVDPTVPLWAKEPTKPSYSYSEISETPTNVSSFTNDSGYLTSFTETDPTVPAWAKASTKPDYSSLELSDSYFGNLADNDFPVYLSTFPGWINRTFDVCKTHAGFVNRTDSTISIDASGVFTLASVGSSYTTYMTQVKRVTSATKTISVTDDQTITYIYLDQGGVLRKSLTVWDLTSGVNIPVAIVFKDGNTYALTDERHGHERNKAWHYWAHNNIGAVYKSGLTGTFTTSTLSITQGIIYDEDLVFDTGGTKTTCSLWYRNATTGMRLIRSSNYAKAVSGGGILQYDNGSGTLQDVTNNRYVTNWVYATNDPTEPIYCVVGQGDYTTLTNARNASTPTINLSTAEWKLIYRVIYQRTTGTPAGIFIESADFRTVQTGVATSASTTDHNSLINRDASNSHPSSAISYDNGGAVLTNVQTELDGRLNKTYVVSIATGDWSTNTYTQTITGLTDADFVDIWATTDTDEGYIDTWGITWTQSGNTITFTKTDSATTTLSLNMAIIKCTDGGTL